jgi:hypothetical protein
MSDAAINPNTKTKTEAEAKVKPDANSDLMKNMGDMNEIFEKVKNRLPMFIINIYCATITLLYGDANNMEIMMKENTNTLNNSMNIFKMYYLFLCISAIVWDLWHSVRAYSNDTTLCSKLCFSFFSFAISFPLFVLTSNLISFGLPFRIFFAFDKNTLLILYGAILIFIYFMNVVENNYWKQSVDKYNTIEDSDDIHYQEKIV